MRYHITLLKRLNPIQTVIVADTSIAMNTINEYFRQSKARFKMWFFDACHAGRIGARATPVGPDIKRHFLVEGEGWATLSACKEDQYSHEDAELGHGIFSYCLVKGLSGDDAATAKQEVTLHSLTMYTITETSEITKERGLPQTPVSDSYHVGNLVLAIVRSIPPAQVPPALIKIQETAIDQLKPTPEKVRQRAGRELRTGQTSTSAGGARATPRTLGTGQPRAISTADGTGSPM